MSKMTRAEFTAAELPELLAQTEFLVEADSFAQHALWQHFSHDSQTRLYPNVQLKWEQVNEGRVEYLGYIGERPIVMSVFFAYLNDKLVGFWHLTSQLADYAMADEFFKLHFDKKYDGTRRCMTDAQNFHQCLHFVQDNKMIVGTKVRFKHNIEKDADDYSPAMIIALKGELGVISESKSGFWDYIVDATVNKGICVNRDEIEPIKE